MAYTVAMRRKNIKRRFFRKPSSMYRSPRTANNQYGKFKKNKINLYNPIKSVNSPN